MKRIAWIAALSLGLVSCATPTPYREAEDGKPGYQDTKLEANKFRVAFNGNESTSRETVEVYLLYRASEVTLANGFDYFIVQEQGTETPTRAAASGPRVATGFGFGGRRSMAGLGFGFGGAPETDRGRYAASAFITAYKGDPPNDNPRAYSARALQENLKEKIKRPEH